ncbi:MAG: hypothetical protein KZQ60_04595 [Candidatus Thiodiazotropha sp. (ex Lucinoma aequizonata)]|nr:hypothetical protein [Candidatus Thiodiazotropha sp. (ex Lucinoma aequizonata)]
MHYSIITTAMTLRRLGCALCMPFISPFRSPFRAYNRAYAYRGLTAFAPLSMAVSGRSRLLSSVVPWPSETRPAGCYADLSGVHSIAFHPLRFSRFSWVSDYPIGCWYLV